jgi:hypothetical protein
MSDMEIFASQLTKSQLGFSDHLSGSHQFLPFQTLTQSSNPRPSDALRHFFTA